MDSKLLDKGFIRNYLTHDALWSESHGTPRESDYLGFGLFYYMLAYGFKCELCVCLGTGGAFVPRMMRQGQIDAELEDSKTIIVDINDVENRKWGYPKWTAKDSFFRSNWPEVEWMETSTIEAADSFDTLSIDFLHIDADHSRAWEDFVLYAPKIKVGRFVTLHDTITRQGDCNAPLAVENIRGLYNWDIVNFPDICRRAGGTALARKIKSA